MIMTYSVTILYIMVLSYDMSLLYTTQVLAGKENAKKCVLNLVLVLIVLKQKPQILLFCEIFCIIMYIY